ncbi:MAG: S1 family peptidase [Corynebacterium sp.]|nr:S1 family peptidase [Corynebacterium sp.]
MKLRRIAAAAATIVIACSGAAVAHAAGIDNDPNYQWSSDPLDKLMAQSAGDVLRRTTGNWFNSPAAPQEALDAEASGHALIGPGTPVYAGDSFCTIAAAGYDKQGNPIALTAGHCGGVGTPVVSADATLSGEIGSISRVNNELDYAVVTLNTRALPTNSYNQITVNHLGGGVVAGEQVCKQGIGSGYSCGVVLALDKNSTVAQICATHGDSGGPVLVDGRLVGLISGGLLGQGLSCVTPWQGPVHQPTVITTMDAILADLPAGFTLA